MSAVLEEDEEETEEQRYQRFFGPAESSTEDDESDEEEAPPAPRLAIESEASALLAKLIGEVLSEAKTRPERETARLACAAAGSFLAQIPSAAGALTYIISVPYWKCVPHGACARDATPWTTSAEAAQ